LFIIGKGKEERIQKLEGEEKKNPKRGRKRGRSSKQSQLVDLGSRRPNGKGKKGGREKEEKRGRGGGERKKERPRRPHT